MHVPRKRPVASPHAPRDPSTMHDGARVPWARGTLTLLPLTRLPSPPTTLLTGPARGKVWSLSAVMQRKALQGPSAPLPKTP